MPNKGKQRHKVAKPDQEKLVSHVLQPQIPEVGDLKFSFRFFQKDHCIFNCTRQKGDFFISFLDVLKKLHNISLEDFQNSRRNTLHAHQIKWENTTHPNGFDHLGVQHRSCTAYQFEIKSREQDGRVYGFLVDSVNTFCVVWIDPDHNLFV